MLEDQSKVKKLEAKDTKANQFKHQTNKKLLLSLTTPQETKVFKMKEFQNVAPRVAIPKNK